MDEGLKQTILNWVQYLKEDLHFTDNDPLFPKEQLQHDEYQQFIGGVALSRNHIESHEPLTRIIKRVFEKACLQYNNPHTFRDMLTHLIITHYGVQELVALSLNLGHETPAITLRNYYQPTPEQQFDILSKIGKPKESQGENKELLEFVRMQMEKEQAKKSSQLIQL